MKKENKISVAQFAREAGLSPKHVYYLGNSGRIKIDHVAGFKVIDRTKYPPIEYAKPAKI